MSNASLTIGRLAAAAGVNVETVRYYQRRGLMPEPPRAPSSVRRYGTRDLARLRFIRRAQPLGFSLEEIGELLALEGAGACGRTLEITERKLADVRQRITALRKLEAELVVLARECRERVDSADCPTLRVLDCAVADG